MPPIYGQVTGWGAYAPSHVVTNHDLERTLDTSDEWIVQRTGIRQRHVADASETTSTTVSYTHLTLPTSDLV